MIFSTKSRQSSFRKYVGGLLGLSITLRRYWGGSATRTFGEFVIVSELLGKTFLGDRL